MQSSTPDFSKYCELGHHNALATVKCLSCKRFMCSDHLHLPERNTPIIAIPLKTPTGTENRPQLKLSTAILDVPRAIVYTKLTLPIERYANRIKYHYRPKTVYRIKSEIQARET